ncbi:MAG TPA: N,N-dimethylformamidase beta subunit family domain-containing protein, partial [Acidimicrobiales bacterium]
MPGGPPPRTRREIQQSMPRRSPNSSSEMDRRYFLRRMFALGGVAAAGAAGYGIYEATSGSSGTPTADAGKPTTGSSTTTSVATKATTTKLADGVTIPTSPAIVAENAKAGHAWWVDTPQNAGDIEGYSSQVSAVAGDTITLFVSTKSPQFHVEAYRMGYYQGIGARMVWQSGQVAGIRQASPALIAPSNTIECNWTPSLTVKVDKTWPPGVYLLKLVGTSSEQQYVPLCVRDDASKAAIVVQQSVTTWQAYNRWGGYSLYYGNTGGQLSFTHAPAAGDYDHRARIVSFDRPYDHDWASGAADFVGNELPVIYQ